MLPRISTSTKAPYFKSGYILTADEVEPLRVSTYLGWSSVTRLKLDCFRFDVKQDVVHQFVLNHRRLAKPLANERIASD